LREAEQSAAYRVSEWRKALSVDADWDDLEELEEMEARGIVPTQNIHDFHERAAHVIRESGGRIHSLTFSYKWEQQYGENLNGFVRRQRLSVPAMLRQSNQFWVVDMQGMMSSEEEGGGGGPQMQVYLLNEHTVQQTGRGLPLGDQLGQHGESDAIREWRQNRRTSTLSRQTETTPSRLAPEIVGLPDSATEWDSALRPNYQQYSASAEEGEDSEHDPELGCLQVPAGLAELDTLGSVLRAIDLSVSPDSPRLGHAAWSSGRCGCAASAVTMLQKLEEVAPQAKGRQERRVEEVMRTLADVVQSGIATVGPQQMAAALSVVADRPGFDSLLLFAANRVLQGGPKFLEDSARCPPASLAALIRVFVKAGQRDPLLYRQLATACHRVPAERWSVDDMAEVLGWLRLANVRDPVLLRHFSSVLQQLPVRALSPAGIARMAGALVDVGVHDEAVFRRLSLAVLQLPGPDFSGPSVASILHSFVRAGLRDPAMLQRLSQLAQGLEPGSLSAEDVTRVMGALTQAGRKDKALLRHMGAAILAHGGEAYSPRQMGVVARALTEAGVQHQPVLTHLAAAMLRMEPWAFDVEAVALIVDAYARSNALDTALFGRLSTVLQQQDNAHFSLRKIGTIVKAYAHPEVEDGALLEKLAAVLQQMDSAVFATQDAVQDVSVILNAYAHSNCRQLALDLSATLTNHLRPHVGVLTAQAMSNIVLRVQENRDAAFHPSASSAVVSRRGGAAATHRAMAKSQWKGRDPLEGDSDLYELHDNAPASWK